MGGQPLKEHVQFAGLRFSELVNLNIQIPSGFTHMQLWPFAVIDVSFLGYLQILVVHDKLNIKK